MLKIEDIKFITEALRTHDLDSEIVVERAADLEVNGLDNTPTAYKLSNGLTYIGDGDTRLRAAQRLQEEGKTIQGVPAGHFPVMLDDRSNNKNFTQNDIRIIQMRGNLTVEKTDNKSFINALYATFTSVTVNGQPITIAQLAKQVGKSEKHVRAMLKTVSLPIKIRELIGKELAFTNAVKLQSVWNKVSNENVYPDGEADKMLESAKKLTVPEFADLVGKFEDEHADKVKASKGNKPVAKGFQPKEKFIGKNAIAEMRDEATSPVEKAIFDKIFSADPASIAIQKAEWERKEEAKAEKQREKKKDSKKVSDLSVEEIKALLEERERENGEN